MTAARATQSRRSATPRNAQPQDFPRARKAILGTAYLIMLYGDVGLVQQRMSEVFIAGPALDHVAALRSRPCCSCIRDLLRQEE